MNFAKCQIVLTLLFTFVCLSNQAIPLKSPCKSDECGTNAACALESRQCKCILGHTPESNNIDCRPIPCESEPECAAKYGPHSICGLFFSSVKLCQCDFRSGWIWDQETLNSCVPYGVRLNQPCRNETDCGRFAICDLKSDQPKCKCRFGYKPDPKSETNCVLNHCKTDSDCAQSDPHAKCDPSSLIPCNCKYESGYVRDLDNDNRCIARSPFIGHNCSTSLQNPCGLGAFCDKSSKNKSTIGVCKCLLGFVPKSNQMDCTQLHCTSDAQCAHLNSNTKCSDEQNCECKLDFKLNWDKQICIYGPYGRISSASAVVWSNLNSILLFVIIMLYNAVQF